MPHRDHDRRIRFDDARAIMEVDFSGFVFDSSARVNAFYDRIEERIAATGEDLWFFLVNLHDMRIDPNAWLAYSRRGRALNHAHSMGSVRFDGSEITRAQILRAADTEAFDPNLFATRDEALARIATMPNTRRPRVVHDRSHAFTDYVRRLAFDEARRIMEVDFSHFTFNNSRDVNEFYDYIEGRIRETDKRWFFLVNLNGCEILPAAWVQYAHRGKRLNTAASLGTVRFAAGAQTETDIRLRAESQGFDPNLCNTREEALDRIAGMYAARLQGVTP
ncbi:hypothetical protein ACFO5X_10680 [Seohaeicola nanhaiensis]|uniref:Uncharacterized protein n=1 Tax=Seohaeicola nanhaiensis TaxID=1387282 RepID=A0ABV9KGD6_9RHOB